VTLPADLRELPFDQYQRYRVAADLLAQLGAQPSARVLEVGGAPGPLEAFLPDFEPVITDVAGKHSGRYVVADGAALPFTDQQFDVVIALDTLEHVSSERRSHFLADVRRVSSDLVVLSAPFAHPDLELAEAAVNEFVQARFGGDFQSLDEHSEHGLPELAATVSTFDADGWSIAVLPSGYLPRWLVGMIVHHELLATGLPDLGKLHAYYNEVVSSRDCRAPSYRQVLLASRVRARDELEAAVGELRADGDDDAARVALSSIASAVFAHRLDGAMQSGEREALRRRLRDAEATVAGLERQLADRDAHILRLGQTISDVRAERDRAIQALALEIDKRRYFGLLYMLRRLLARVRPRNPQRTSNA
jgi:SAM-dependent methyltransferase